MQWHPGSPSRTIDFSRPVSEHLATIELLQLPLVKEYGFGKIIQKVIRDGVFLSCSWNREQDARRIFGGD